MGVASGDNNFLYLNRKFSSVTTPEQSVAMVTRQPVLFGNSKRLLASPASSWEPQTWSLHSCLK